MGNGIETKIAQYADDTVLFMDNTAGSIIGALEELETFSNMSGLKLNIEKTSCMSFGPNELNDDVNNLGINWVDKMKVLGVFFPKDIDNISEININPKLVQIRKEIDQWKRRHVTSIGRITVVKSLIMSKLVHLLIALPNPPLKLIKEMEQMFFHFVWGGKRDPLKRNMITQKYENGGLCMIDVTAFINSMKLSWLRKLIFSQSLWAQLIDLEIGGAQKILCFGTA